MPRFCRRFLTAILAAAFVVGAAVLVQPAPAAAAFPGENGRIVYGWEGAIWTVNPDGSDPRKLTSPSGHIEDWHPTWSPGGTFITFQRLYGVGTSELWIMEADGSNQRMLFATDEPLDEYAPAWSPDAARVTFTADWPPNEAPLGHPRKDIWTADLDGGDPVRLTFDGVGEGHKQAELSRWSPTGEWIAFRTFIGTDEGETSTLEVIRPDGTDRRIVSDTDPGKFSWSPDGSRIVYAMDGGGSLHVVDVAGGTEEQLLDEGDSPAWSPDGSQIAYVAGADGIKIVPATGGEPVTIGIEANSRANIDWQPVPGFVPADARFSRFFSSILWLYEEGLTSGCAPERFCPDRSVTRGELADWLVEALELPPATADHFVDDERSTHEDEINALVEAGLARGCGPGAFCPNASLTRAELATFFVRAFELAPTDVDHFVDDERSSHEANINRLASAGLSSGCAEDRYCPESPVSRGQMAAFLKRAMT